VPSRGRSVGQHLTWQQPDREVSLPGEDRLQQGGSRGRGGTKVGVQEQEYAAYALTLVERGQRHTAGLQRGGLAGVPGVPDHERAGGASHLSGGVGRSVVDDEDEVDPRDPTRGLDGRSEPRGLVEGRHDHGDRSGHRPEG